MSCFQSSQRIQRGDVPTASSSSSLSSSRRRPAARRSVFSLRVLLLVVATTATALVTSVDAFSTITKPTTTVSFYPTNNVPVVPKRRRSSTFGSSRSSSTRVWSTSASAPPPAAATTSTSTTSTTSDSAAASNNNTAKNKLRLATAMAFLTGWADMVLNVRLGTFCSMMTGNLLWMIRAMSELNVLDGLYYASVVLSYCGGLVVYRQWQTKEKETSNKPLLLTVAGTVVLLFGVADALLLQGLSSSILLAKWLPACLLSAGFAMINGVGLDSAGAMTFVLTGHLTKLTTAIVDDRQEHSKASWMATLRRLRHDTGVILNIRVLLGFLGGAMFANALRLSKIFTTKSSRLYLVGEFTWIGLLFGGLCLWKHRSSLETTTTTTSSAPSTTSKKPWIQESSSRLLKAKQFFAR